MCRVVRAGRSQPERERRVGGCRESVCEREEKAEQERHLVQEGVLDGAVALAVARGGRLPPASPPPPPQCSRSTHSQGHLQGQGHLTHTQHLLLLSHSQGYLLQGQGSAVQGHLVGFQGRVKVIVMTHADPFTLEAVTQAAIILGMAVLIIITNVIIIATFVNARGRGEVMNCYVVSLSVADLLCGVLVVPLSVYPALVEQWVYGDLVCRLVGYVQVTLWAVTVYTFMWISVDRYLAVRKPLRYETVQTKTRCQCWMAFTWISAAMMCCPPLLGFNQPKFDHDALVCMLDWQDMAAYATTLAILVLGPSLITIVYTYGYIFGMMRKLRQGAPIHDKEYATALSENLANPSHVMSFVLVFTFWLAWLPFILLRLYEHWSGHRINLAHLHFAVFWLGIFNSTLKLLILVCLSPQFRLMLRCLCLSLCCRSSKSRLLQMQLIGMDADD